MQESTMDRLYERFTGEPCAVKAASTVRRGAVGKGLLRQYLAGRLPYIHLAVQDGAAALHAAVVTTADDLALMHQDRTDRNAAFGQACFRLRDGNSHEGIHVYLPRGDHTAAARGTNTFINTR